MERRTIEIEAESLDAGRTLVRSTISPGHKILTERVVSPATQTSVNAAADTIEKAFSEAHSRIPPNATITGERVISTRRQETISVEAFDESSARAQVADILTKRGCTLKSVSIQSVRIAEMGKKGLLGFSKKPNRYEANVVFPAEVRVSYQTKVKLQFIVGEPPENENISVLVFDLWSTMAPPNPKSFCQQILEDRYPGASLWSHYMVGYRDNLTTEEASKQYRQFVFDGRLPDLGKEIGSFKGQTPNGNVFVVLFFSPKIEQTKVTETQQFPSVQADFALNQSDEISNLIRTAQNKNAGYEERARAIQKLKEIGDSRAIEPLMQIYNTELHLIRLDALDAAEKIKARGN